MINIIKGQIYIFKCFRSSRMGLHESSAQAALNNTFLRQQKERKFAFLALLREWNGKRFFEKNICVDGFRKPFVCRHKAIKISFITNTASGRGNPAGVRHDIISYKYILFGIFQVCELALQKLAHADDRVVISSWSERRFGGTFSLELRTEVKTFQLFIVKLYKFHKQRNHCSWYKSSPKHEINKWQHVSNSC